MTNNPVNEPSALGQRVAKYRKEAGYASAEKLAEAIIEAGAPPTFKKSTVRNLENGRKQDVTVTELLWLSRMLRISPIMLIVDTEHLSGKPDYPGIGITNNYYFMRWLLMCAYYPGEQFFSEDTVDKTNRARMLVAYMSRYISARTTIEFEKSRFKSLGTKGMDKYVMMMKDAQEYAQTLKSLVSNQYNIDLSKLYKQIVD